MLESDVEECSANDPQLAISPGISWGWWLVVQSYSTGVTWARPIGFGHQLRLSPNSNTVSVLVSSKISKVFQNCREVCMTGAVHLPALP